MVIKMNVPKLRFKEFEEEWKKNKLGHLCTFAKGNGLSKSDLSNEGKECILYGELYTTYSEIIRKINSYTDKDSSSFIYSKFNDVLIPASGETPIEIAKASCILKENVILGGDLNILSPKNMDGRFLAYQIGSSRKLEFANLSQGHSVVHLYGDKIKNVNIYYPSPKEQEKISNTLELLDKKIELQSKKIEALKLYKLCILKYVFSSATIKTKLKSIGNIKKGEQINSEELSKSGSYYMLNGGTEPSGYLEKYNTLENTITISEGGNSCGYVKYNKCKFWCGGHCYSIENKMIDNHYLYQLLKFNENKIMRLRIGSGLPNIQKKDLENFELSIHEKNDQHKIAKLLIKFDTKIELEQDLLNLLLNLKKGLMQNIFV